MRDPLAPSDGVPPRQVEPWTRVTGHVVVANRPQAFCSCGDGAPRDWAGTGREWRDEHLRDAWPELVPQLESESADDWFSRVALAHGDALHALSDLPTLRDSQPIPVITNEDMDADDRLQVLEHQLNTVQVKIAKRNGWA
ncbi:hypothetical protein [Nocardioides pacificus]